ncbi:XdhC family protein [Ideonella margarita]|uniref:XdhC family protein n=1 Tax=Ideonella margarita TaxID=2984191 RepID=A0ABU9C2Y1_9BURK
MNQLVAPDLTVLRTAQAWLAAGDAVWLATVIDTYGSAPRPVGAMAAVNQRGEVVGSVSGGCIEDDITDWLRRDALACKLGTTLVYGVNADERARLRLPCNGHLMLWLEPADAMQLAQLLGHIDAGHCARRTLQLTDGTAVVSAADPGERCRLIGQTFVQVLGPTHRLVLIGASDVSRYLAPMALGLGFAVQVVDPRTEYLSTWPHAGCELLADMPDDLLLREPADVNTAVVALSHDPKLDDLALMEALQQPAFYVGAMGSPRTTQARKARLAQFDLDADALARLRGPVGLDIGARTPPEIAISVAADLVRVMRQGESRSPVAASLPSRLSSSTSSQLVTP